MKIEVVQDILQANKATAQELRTRFQKDGIVVINVLGSPGSGKTSLIERTLARLKGELKMAVIEGDIATTLDAQRIAQHEVPIVQINTGGTCHLTARMVGAGLEKLNLQDIELLLIENVGNLVCPATYDLGESARALISSVPEGDDKPAKYPIMFRQTSGIILNKTDLLSVVDFDLEGFKNSIGKLNPQAEFFPLSCQTGEGMEPWLKWVKRLATKVKQ